MLKSHYILSRSITEIELTLVIFAALASTDRPVRAADSRAKPNIVIILADDLGYGDTSCYGATLVHTPHIDRLAKEGRRFTDAHAPSSVCSPSRYGLLTGRYCWRTSLQRGVLGINSPLHIEPARMTVASLLKTRGYATAAVGKWHLGYGGPLRPDYDGSLSPGPNEIGFDYHFGVPTNHADPTRCFVENDRVVGRRPKQAFVLGDNFALPTGLAQPRVDDRVDVVLAEKAAAWLDKNHDRPFLLYFAPVAVHDPVTPNKQFRGQSKCGLLGDYIHELDWCVGQILAALDRHKLADNTLVFFSSDNGAMIMPGTDSEEFPMILENDDGGVVSAHYRKAHRTAFKAGHRSCGDLRGSKGGIYEGSHRVPFIARWSGHIPAGTTSDEPLGLTDVLATVAGLMEEKLPFDAGEDSYDVGPALHGDKIAKPIREAVVTHSIDGAFAIRHGPWKLIAGGAAPNDNPNRPQLFHLGADPKETTDVQEKHPEVVERLTKLLNQYREQGSSRARP